MEYYLEMKELTTDMLKNLAESQITVLNEKTEKGGIYYIIIVSKRQNYTDRK